VRTESIEASLKEGELAVHLPSLKAPVVYTTSYAEQKTNGDFDWYGEEKESAGNWISLKKKDGKIFGSLSYSGRNFRLRNLEADFPVLVELKQVRQNHDHCSSNKHMSLDTPPAPDYDKVNCEPLRVIRILTLYSTAANATGLNPVTEAADMIGNSNIALINSGLNDVRFEGAGVQVYNGFTETDTDNPVADIDNDFLTLSNDLNNPMSAIAGFRDGFNADLVVLFVDGRAGLAPIQADNAYAIVEIDGGDNTTYTHEVGHNLGCRHDNDNTTMDPLIGNFANAQLFTAGGNDFKTVVASGLSPGAEILNFSNPGVNFNGVPTGTVNDRNNARQIDENTACPVSCYQLGGDPMNVFISGLNMANAGQTASWCANVSDCNNITSYNWAYSTNGFNYTNIFGGACVSFTVPSGVSQFFLRVTVTCNNGEQAEDVHRVFVQGGNGGGGPQPIAPGTYESTEQSFALSAADQLSFTVFPNPVNNDRVNLRIQSEQAQEGVSFVLRDVSGKEVFSKTTQHLIEGENNYTFPVRNTLPGVYIMQVSTSIGPSLFQKIIIR